MSYHLNDEKKSMPCGAQSIESCPFKNNTQKFVRELERDGFAVDFDNKVVLKNNHYETRHQAVQAVEAILEVRNPMKSQNKQPSAEFIENREVIKETLIKYGGVSEKDIPEVNSAREMVKVWFKGNRSAYTTFKFIARTNENMQDETRREIALLVRQNFKVTPIREVSSIGKNKTQSFDPENQSSDISIIDDMSDSISIEDVRSGKINPLSF